MHQTKSKNENKQRAIIINKRATMALKRSPEKGLPKSNLPLSDLFFNNHLKETLRKDFWQRRKC